MVWTVPKIWEGGECFILAGGTSIVKQFQIPDEIVKEVLVNKAPPALYSPFLSAIHDRHVIGVNKSYVLGDWIDFMFYGDKVFGLENKALINRNPSWWINIGGRETRAHYLDRDGSVPVGLSPHPQKLSWNYNSGAAAIDLAVHFGCTRIYLLGFDMNLVNGNQHWHKFYGTRNPKSIQGTFQRHLRSFPSILKDAETRGVQIVNLNPESAVQCFEKANLWDVLSPQDYAVCVLKSGGDYDGDYVYKLREGIMRNTSLGVKFRCLTDRDDLKLNPAEVIRLEHGLPGWWSKMELFRPGLFPEGSRVVYFDLDTLITNDIDSLWLDQSQPFYMLGGFVRDEDMSGVMAWNADLSWIWKEFIQAPDLYDRNHKLKWDQKYLAQLWLSRKLSRPGKIQDLVSVKSFKLHLRPKMEVNGTQVICFHGLPRPHQVAKEIKQYWHV